jgi:hypothetical protein
MRHSRSLTLKQDPIVLGTEIFVILPRISAVEKSVEQ